MIQKKRGEHPSLPILIMVRDTPDEAYPAAIRAEYIKIWLEDQHLQGTIMIIPNIEGLYWGRGVGYNVGEVDVDVAVKQISGTTIRNLMTQAIPGWEKVVANPKAARVLTRAISKILTRGKVVWLTGCPSSGKTTIANALIQKIQTMYPYLKIQLLDGDDMRASPLARGAGFSKKERALHILKMAHLARMFADHGILVICAFVSPDRNVRKKARDLIGNQRFVEVYVKASQKTRLRRDAKGMYKKAMAGKLPHFTGLTAPYDVPRRPNVLCATDKHTVTESVENILSYILMER